MSFGCHGQEMTRVTKGEPARMRREFGNAVHVSRFGVGTLETLHYTWRLALWQPRKGLGITEKCVLCLDSLETLCLSALVIFDTL